jgi:hypothetical protein
VGKEFKEGSGGCGHGYTADGWQAEAALLRHADGAEGAMAMAMSSPYFDVLREFIAQVLFERALGLGVLQLPRDDSVLEVALKVLRGAGR